CTWLNATSMRQWDNYKILEQHWMYIDCPCLHTPDLLHIQVALIQIVDCLYAHTTSQAQSCCLRPSFAEICRLHYSIILIFLIYFLNFFFHCERVYFTMPHPEICLLA